MKVTPAMIIDTLFSSFIAFLLCFILANCFIDRIIAISLSITLGAVFGVFVFSVLFKKKFKSRIKGQQKKEKEQMVNTLNFLSKEKQIELLTKAVKKEGEKAEKQKGAIFIHDKKIALFIKFNFDGISKTDIVRIFNSIKSDYIAYVFCTPPTSDVQNFAERFDGRIKLVNEVETYKFLKKHDELPDGDFPLEKRNKATLSSFKNLIKKSKAKSHFWLGFVFICTSYFVPIKLYYVIFGCIFLILSLFCRLFGKPDNISA